VLYLIWTRNGQGIVIYMYDNGLEQETKSLAVAVIADRTAYDDGILAKYQTGFAYKFTNGWYARSDSTDRIYELTQTLLKRDH